MLYDIRLFLEHVRETGDDKEDVERNVRGSGHNFLQVTFANMAEVIYEVSLIEHDWELDLGCEMKMLRRAVRGEDPLPDNGR